jgi:hypothetical protein
MGKFILLPCAALFVAAAPVTAAAPVVANQVAPSDEQQAARLSGGGAAPAVQDKKICKQLDTTGSRLPRRACLTAKEWKQLQDELDQ